MVAKDYSWKVPWLSSMRVMGFAGRLCSKARRDNKDVKHIRILPISAMPWTTQLQAQKQTFSCCNRNKMLMAVAWGIWSNPASLPSLHRQPGTFTDCFLQQVEDEYVHNTGKPHSPALHSICQEHRLCTPALKRFSIEEEKSAFDGCSGIITALLTPTSRGCLRAIQQNGLSKTLCVLRCYIYCCPSCPWIHISM